MDNVEIVKTLVHHVRQSFLDVMENVDQEVADWLPTGEAHPIRTSAAHILWVEDAFFLVSPFACPGGAPGVARC